MRKVIDTQDPLIVVENVDLFSAVLSDSLASFEQLDFMH